MIVLLFTVVINKCHCQCQFPLDVYNVDLNGELLFILPNFLGSEINIPLDFFPNWRNSVQIAILQIIGHALLRTNFNTLQFNL